MSPLSSQKDLPNTVLVIEFTVKLCGQKLFLSDCVNDHLQLLLDNVLEAFKD
jgi:hypothetical protein